MVRHQFAYSLLTQVYTWLTWTHIWNPNQQIFKWRDTSTQAKNLILLSLLLDSFLYILQQHGAYHHFLRVDGDVSLFVQELHCHKHQCARRKSLCCKFKNTPIRGWHLEKISCCQDTCAQENRTVSFLRQADICTILVHASQFAWEEKHDILYINKFFLMLSSTLSVNIFKILVHKFNWHSVFILLHVVLQAHCTTTYFLNTHYYWLLKKQWPFIIIMVKDSKEVGEIYVKTPDILIFNHFRLWNKYLVNKGFLKRTLLHHKVTFTHGIRLQQLSNRCSDADLKLLFSSTQLQGGWLSCIVKVDAHENTHRCSNPKRCCNIL